MIALVVPSQKIVDHDQPRAGALFDFRPVFKNRSAMAYAFAYAMHTLEMSAVRGWGVVFLGYVAMREGAAATVLSPAIVVTALALLGTVSSVGGNEASIRFGRRNLVSFAIFASIVAALATGLLGPLSYSAAAGLLFVYGFVIWLDSSSLTAGTAGTAEPERRGATLAIHSMLGYAGGFVGPLLVGVVLDLAGGTSQLGWALSFAALAACMTIALVVFWWIRPAELAGDRGT